MRTVPKDIKLRHELYAFVKDAKSAYSMTRALLMFSFMEFGSCRDPVVMSALAVAAKVVAYQHFILNKRKYGLGKKKPVLSSRRRD